MSIYSMKEYIVFVTLTPNVFWCKFPTFKNKDIILLPCLLYWIVSRQPRGLIDIGFIYLNSYLLTIKNATKVSSK